MSLSPHPSRQALECSLKGQGWQEGHGRDRCLSPLCAHLQRVKAKAESAGMRKSHGSPGCSGCLGWVGFQRKAGQRCST